MVTWCVNSQELQSWWQTASIEEGPSPPAFELRHIRYHRSHIEAAPG